MTYCLAIAVDQGLVLCSDSRTNAGIDQVSTYGKMHTFTAADRQLVVLSAGNLAATQAVIQQLRRDVRDQTAGNLLAVRELEEAAALLGEAVRRQGARYGEAVSRAGINADATFILGGEIAGAPHQLFLIYPQGNYITTSEQTPYLQLGESKYGKPILDRILERDTSLDEAARCALVSMDSTMRSNVAVGPPVELLKYAAGSLRLEHYLRFDEHHPYWVGLGQAWHEKIRRAFSELQPVAWGQLPNEARFR